MDKAIVDYDDEIGDKLKTQRKKGGKRKFRLRPLLNEGKWDHTYVHTYIHTIGWKEQFVCVCVCWCGVCLCVCVQFACCGASSSR